jgi:hypothetical protein
LTHARHLLRVAHELPHAVAVDTTDASLLRRLLLRVRKDFEGKPGREDTDGKEVGPAPGYELDTRLTERGGNRESDERLEDGLRYVGRDGRLGPERGLGLVLVVPLVVTPALGRGGGHLEEEA